MILFLLTALAADRVEGSDTLAMGGATTAHPYAMGGIAANPAAIGLTSQYTFGVGASYGGRGLHWYMSAIDTVTSPFAFGLTYSGDRYNPPITAAELPGWQVPGQPLTNKKRNQDLGLVASVPFAERRFVIGIGGSVSFFNHEHTGKGTTGNMTAGIAARPHELLSLAASVRNFLPIQDRAQVERPLEIMGGLWTGKRGVAQFGLDGGVNLDAEDVWMLGGGVQVDPSAGSAIRGGWRFEDGAHHATLGGGLGSPDASINLAVLAPIDALGTPLDWTAQLSVRFKGPDPEAIRPD